MSIRNLDALFEPKAIALVGASNRPGSVGEVLARNIFGSGFKGPVMPVNPHEQAIRSTVSYRSVADLPTVPDLAVIATPAPSVPAIVDELGRRGCRAAVVISTGFADGRLRQELLDAAKPHLLRIVGPNCIGLISPAAGLNASFSHLTPKAGDIAFVSQSGAIASAVLDWADVREIGFSHVVSVGDMSDVDIGDLLDYLALDAKTRAILLYVESITSARKFMTAARIASRTKPVVVIKAGRTDAGARAAASHTGALAGSDAVYDAAFRRAGMLRVGSLRELFEAVATLATGIRPRGDRLAILTNGGGAGVLATDTLSDCGGRLAQLSEETLRRLGGILPPDGSPSNPVDMPGDTPPEVFAQALAAILEDPEQDGVLILNCPQAVSDGLGAAEATLAAARTQVSGASRKAPLLTCWLGERAARGARRLFAANGIPTYQTPDESVRAFMQLVDYRRNQDLLMETPPALAPGVSDLSEARRVVETALAQGRPVLTEPESKRLLSAYGIPVVRTETARTPEEAMELAAAIGFPVALKILSSDITHKSEVGGVRLDLDTAEMVGEAAHHMLKLVAERQPAARIDGFTVQAMIQRPRAHELIAGVATDPAFGPVLLFGQGGTAAEIIADRAIGLPPLNELLARDLIGRTRVAKLLGGYRDRPAADLGAIASTMVKLSQMLADFDEIAELDINPLLADESGVLALDARVVLRPTDDGAHRRSRFAIQPYPSELEGVVRSRGGTAFHLRPIRPEDEPGIIRMIEASEPNDIRLRFFASIRKVGHAFAARLTQIDYSREMAFVIQAETGPHDDILGVARLIADPNEEIAEFGIMVRSDQKGRGIGWMLMHTILAYARKRGFAEIYGEVLTENTTMLAMARDLGFTQRSHPDDVGLRKVVIKL
ncbi:MULTISPECIES: bifunctional acetate--CoA ligase family protein/GNAT family N-acetyltransferase [unclassified Aureimonas]|uniref:bifunctional acetate--CoA ligase family protein/GNAT family N-acetyltransferase n=1 Tax=unclassified Aureimonas TaxID=2615206 RepID=UPI0006FD17A1|nr:MULTISPECIES: bifunctional acetate--CoA ligase family protein/GNAT family N-acetyltransferase [unclassified Aureimonas]KQT61276.1 GCN5 family acetyltransferase [Aureimonas sp. Leaf460]KQT68725.1 GCN5 family acetyltransferase [Aureimonas sp. Leaf427]